MRLFVAVAPPPAVAEEVEDAVAALRSHSPALRWTLPEDRHLTLVFLGEVPESHVPGVERRLGTEAARHHPFSLVVRGGGTFPEDAAQAQVLWAAVEGDVHRLTLLSYGLRKAARKSGINVSRRPYVPHLTLARSRGPADLSELRGRLDGIESTHFTAADVHLVHSRTGSRPRYETIARWDLAPHPNGG
ncbi:2'-5' RNA ligase [Lipingzhangella halophila]|uniref:RNA 2',3'-cyclic phosphodiesterase n=1 Tax=Lipingzhangella halophila TaxID=1783352 RepID=A0A7W7RLA6_9ACTN|nr:RNA 2',3'-cyclic phosphodiesterase [Lipingzhangella halophila]MBB4934070.1 2'-5' RNA ligase [Lipingzhangella halophila]